MSEAVEQLRAEKARLEGHIDAAFSRVVEGDLAGARVELTNARWGQLPVWSHPANTTPE